MDPNPDDRRRRARVSTMILCEIRVGEQPPELVRIRDLEGEAAGRTIGLAWRGTDPRDGAFRDLAAFLREVAPAGTSVVAAPGQEATERERPRRTGRAPEQAMPARRRPGRTR